MQKKILITGASGFVGSTVVEKALELGYETWAGIRVSSNREYLKDERIHFIYLNYSNKNKLVKQLSEFSEAKGKFDYVVHVAGITKARKIEDFEDVNYMHTRNLADSMIESNTVPESFIFVSSMGAIGMVNEETYEPISVDQTPNPITAYGKSKLKAEKYLMSLSNFPFVIIRPTGVYGPRDKDYLILMKAVKSGLNVGAGLKKQILSFIFSEDLSKVIFLSIEKGMKQKVYHVSDGDIYTDDEFMHIVQTVLKKKRVITIKFPLFTVRTAAYISEKVSGLFGKTSTFNTDKYKIMKQRNWNCDISAIQNDLGFVPDYPLLKGVEKTVAWYKSQGWL
ncbi:MAG: NAD(P)-dependent oxidoreductase [Dysgonamonadaceae bacterium]|jgi:nucleoside-diphosphate-sugar epimerase|nr:NAD(P)-dependent oxidoreductase [Dysgonamonadaceae bacterium]